MTTILKRELQSYFLTPVGYLYLLVFFFFAGFYFSGTTLLNNSTSLNYVFANLFHICIFLIPVLTMRLFSEDRKNKTEQLLLTCPVRLSALAAGKYLAALTIFCLGASITLVFALVVGSFAAPDWPVILGNLVGLLLLGSTLISIGMFLSSLTENQIVAAVGSFAAGLLFLLADSLASILPQLALKRLFTALSFNSHYNSFTQGILSLTDCLYFLSVSAVFFLLTVFFYERRQQLRHIKTRWLSNLLALTLMTVILLVNLIAAIAADRYPLSADLTREKLYAVSDETKNSLSGLTQPVHLTVLCDALTLEKGGGYFTQTRRLLEQYDTLSQNISVEYLDLIANPQLSAQYPDLALEEYDILITSKEDSSKLNIFDLFHSEYNEYTGKQHITSSKAEQELTSAILRITAEEAVSIVLLTGHGESYSQELYDFLTLRGFTVTTQDILTQPLPSDADIALLLTPSRDFSAENLVSLDNYLTNGGAYGKTLLYLPGSEVFSLPNLEAFLKQWGIVYHTGLVMESNPARYMNSMPYLSLIDHTSTDVSDSLSSAPFFSPLGRELETAFAAQNGFEASVPMQYSATAFAMPAGAEADWKPADSDFKEYPALIHSCFTQQENGSEKSSSIFAFASPAAFDDTALTDPSFCNGDYLAALLSSQGGQKSYIRIPAKTIVSTQLGITQAQFNLLSILFMAVLPVLTAFSGITVWLLRRNK